ncbi:hypothetical protein SERLA73DRAFT_179327 [Serpula lacrymans var. lacrymans S7.3]|uniref:Uncharacterized protein n=1 Tax=Serpula lacrymans var. lacrymans (strain S7.3) TaxID=936435 RepID=F8PRX6_SERL3|nr:hypothetical protein SERLA73DRAFT_179327 [Serpula lacrymans var. lacrymans S7.3]
MADNNMGTLLDNGLDLNSLHKQRHTLAVFLFVVFPIKAKLVPSMSDYARPSKNLSQRKLTIHPLDVHTSQR